MNSEKEKVFYYKIRFILCLLNIEIDYDNYCNFYIQRKICETIPCCFYVNFQ